MLITSRLSGLSIVVPVYNEERTIVRILSDLLGLEVDFPLEIILVDDGSSDGTPEKIKGFTESANIKFIRTEENQGKGHAVQQGIHAASLSHLLIFDADEEYFVTDIPKLFFAIQQGYSDVVFGARIRGVNTMQPSLVHAIGRTVMTLFANILYGTAISDLHTCLKLVPVELLIDCELKEKGFGLDTELTCHLLRSRIHPFEVPITYVGRSIQSGKKIRIRDAVVSFKIILFMRFSRRNKLSVKTYA